MTNLLAHKIELYPTENQKIYLEKSFGSKRHCYNQLLNHFQKEGVKWSKKAAYEVYKDLKTEFDWYSEVSQRVTYNTLDDLDFAYRNFFRRVKSGKKPGYPKFKRKGVNESFALRDPVRFDVKDGRWLRIERLKTRIKMSQEVRFEGKQKQVTISKSPSGKYYASILVETDDYTKKAGTGTVGVDLGITNLAILSNGEEIPANQKLKESLKKLQKYQRKLSKKQKGSNRRAKAKLKVARIHARIANQRRSTLHDLTDYLTKTYHTICIEDLNVKGMVKNRKLSRAISDAGFGAFRQFLEYKARLRGNQIHLVNRFFPSSKMCSGCGLVKTELSLKDRVFKCDHCNLEISRDLNAAINLERTDQFKVLVSDTGEDVFKPTTKKRTQELSEPSLTGSVNVDGVNEGRSL